MDHEAKQITSHNSTTTTAAPPSSDKMLPLPSSDPAHHLAPSSDPPQPPPSSDPASHPPHSPATPTNPRLLTLQTRLTTLQSTLADLQATRASLASQTLLPSGLPLPRDPDSTPEEDLALALKTSNAVIKDHIKLLHRYNEIKDIGQGLMGLVAEGRGKRVGEVQEEFGMGVGD